MYLRGGGVSATLNCGYGRGFSVLEVIETVKRVSGVDFEVAFAGRRAGDPAQIVAASDRARSLLKWQPLFDDLRTIVCHALAWERKLLTCAVDFRRYSWRLQPVFEAELLGPTRAQIEVLEPPAYLLACHTLFAAPLLRG